MEHLHGIREPVGSDLVSFTYFSGRIYRTHGLEHGGIDYYRAVIASSTHRRIRGNSLTVQDQLLCIQERGDAQTH